jgi:hypothetical protein
MDNAFNLGKRVFAAAVASVTILATMGFAAFVAPQTASAASMGDVITGTSLSATYFYGWDGSRYTFPNEKTYETWFDGFDDVEEISDAALGDIDLAGNVVYRPGSRWVKIDTANPTYAVGRDGAIHWIETEDVAVDYAGDDWNQNIDDVPDVFFVDYSEGASLMTATVWDGAMYMDGGNYYLAWDGEARMVDAAGRSANNMEDRFFLDGDGMDASSLTAGDDITGEVCDVVDASQTGCTVVPTGGDLMVSVATSTAASMTVPDAASGVEVATFALTAGDATSLSSLAVYMGGLAATATFAANGVYLYEDGVRLTDGKSVNSSTRQATFSGLNLDFAAGQTRNLSIRVDMNNQNLTATFDARINDAADVMTDGTVSGSFPAQGNTHDVIDLAVGGVTVAATGSLANPTLGAEGAEVAKLNIDATGTEDVGIDALTLNTNNSSDHSGWMLWQGSDEIATCSDIGNDLVYCPFDEQFMLEEGQDRDFTLTATIGGESTDTIDTHLDNDADLDAVGLEFGFGVGVTRTAYDATSATCVAETDTGCSLVTVQGGEITIADNGPTAGDIKNGANDVTLLDFSMTADRWAEVQNLEIDLTGTDLEDGVSETAVTDIRISNAGSGALVAGPEELSATGGDTQAIAFTDNFVINAGETLNLLLTGDINDTQAADGDTLTATLDISEFTIEDDAGDSITDIVPSADIVGGQQTVTAPSFAVSMSASPTGDRTFVRGSGDVDAVAYNFTSGTASAMELTDLTVAVFIEEDSDGDAFTQGTDGTEGTVEAENIVSSCNLIDTSDDSIVDGPESPSNSTAAGNGGDLIFSGFSWWVDAGSTGTLLVECVLGDSDPGAAADEFALEVVAATDVTAVDEDGDGVTETLGATPLNGDEAVKISVAQAGTLTVTNASSTPDEEFVMTGSSDNWMSGFRFDAANEGFVVDRLTVTEEEGETHTGTADSSAYANNVSNVEISFPQMDGSTGTASGSLTGNEITFNGIEFYVEKDDDAQVDVMVDIATSDRSGGSAQSNEEVRMGLSRDAAADDQFRAIGQASDTLLDDDDVDTTAGNASVNAFVVRETVPVFSLHASSPGGTGYVPEDQEVLRFNVAANAGEDVVLDEFVFDMSSTDLGTSGWNDSDAHAATATEFDFYQTSALSTPLDVNADWVSIGADGADDVLGTTDADIEFVRLTLTTPEVVGAGTTVTYSLYYDSEGASAADDDTVRFSIPIDPIVAAYLDSALDLDADPDEDDVDLTADGAIGTAITAGDVVCISTDTDCDDAADETVLAVEVAGTTLTVVRGYLGDAPVDHAGTENLLRVPGSLLWEDDGAVADTTTEEEFWGAYLVDGLPLDGSSLQF